MKYMDKVLVCWDGKWGRAKLGTIVKTSKGNKILVRYSPHYSDEVKVTEQWFKLISKNKGIKKFGGWTTEFGWCSIVKPKKLLAAGYLEYWKK